MTTDTIFGVCRNSECSYVWTAEPKPRGHQTTAPTCPSCGRKDWPMTPVEAEARFKRRRYRPQPGDRCPSCGGRLVECPTCEPIDGVSGVLCENAGCLHLRPDSNYQVRTTQAESYD